MSSCFNGMQKIGQCEVLGNLGMCEICVESLKFMLTHIFRVYVERLEYALRPFFRGFIERLLKKETTVDKLVLCRMMGNQGNCDFFHFSLGIYKKF